MKKISLKEKLKKNIVLLDGAFGTYAQSIGLEDDYFKDKLGCMEYLNFTKPEFVSKIHNAYFEAGSNAVETNTFGGNALKLDEYGLLNRAYELNLTATRLARISADEFSSGKDAKYVIGAMGPTGKLPSSSDPVLGDITYEQLKKIYCDQALGMIDGGADALLIETGQDLLEMKAAVTGAKEALKQKRKDLVLMAQCTLANNGRMLLGTDISAVMTVLNYIGADVVGVNCSTGPLEMESVLRFLSLNSPSYVSCVPNAGLPIEREGEVIYPLVPDEMAEILSGFLKKFKIDVVGGCCGTTPDHIRQIRNMLPKPKKNKRPKNMFYSSFYKGYDIKEIQVPIKVGERINTQGSRKMKDMLRSEDFDGIIELGKYQQSAGSDILDVCSVLTERPTEARDSVILTRRLAESVQVPLMIDSTDELVIRSALENYPGTAFINSVNLEDSGDKARKIFKLAKEHAGFIVCLVIDEEGMAKTVERKLEIAERLYRMAVDEFKIEPHRLIFDMLTFTLGTGEKEYAESAKHTYEAIKKVKKKYPGVLTVLGVSNISFGLPKDARKILNMIFLHGAVKKGLDMAIINPSEYVAYEDIPAKESKLSEKLILNKSAGALSSFVEHFQAISGKPILFEVSKTEYIGSIKDKLEKCIFDRNKSGIISLVDEGLKKYSAKEIMNDILMPAMKEVGDKLDCGEMVLPYVLQSAEVMRKAIEHLGESLSSETVSGKGKVLLATVFGDVHDIGKNLVKMILENNGFKVIDLGKQVPIEKIVKEAKKNKVDAVGLSALLVSTAQHMKTCVQSMHDAGLNYPVLIGGAPVNENFAREISLLKDKSLYTGGVFYSKDAFTGLSIMQTLADPSEKQAAFDKYVERSKTKGKSEEQTASEDHGSRIKDQSSRVKPVPPFYGARTIVNIPADDIFSCLNEGVLFDLSWGTKLKNKDDKDRVIKEEYKPLLKELKEEAIRKGWLDFKAVYGYYKCRVNGVSLEIQNESGKTLQTIDFSDNVNRSKASIIDYFRNDPEGYDIVAFQAVTVGGKINKAIEELNKSEEFTRAFFLHGMSVHLAEAVASYMHERVRNELKLDKGQGQRYSPGYPLWKDLADQVKIFDILAVEKNIGIYLTEGYQMVPEQSTTAMIVYDRKAKY